MIQQLESKYVVHSAEPQFSLRDIEVEGLPRKLIMDCAEYKCCHLV